MSATDAGTSRGFRTLFRDGFGCKRETTVTILSERTVDGLPCILTRHDAYWRRGGHATPEHIEPDEYEDKFVGWVYAPEVDTPLAGYSGIRPLRETRGGWVGFAERADSLGGRTKTPAEHAGRRLDTFAGWLRRHSKWNVCDCGRPQHNATEPHDADCAVRTDYWYPERPEPWGEHIRVPTVPEWLVSRGDYE